MAISEHACNQETAQTSRVPQTNGGKKTTFHLGDVSAELILSGNISFHRWKIKNVIGDDSSIVWHVKNVNFYLFKLLT